MLDVYNDQKPLEYSYWEHEIVIWQIGVCTFQKTIAQFWGVS
jgi:hypothetical protein